MRDMKKVMAEKMVTDKIYCNICGEEILKDNYGYFKDHIHIEKQWGYNSTRDGEVHSIDICESCYNIMVKGFKIPI